MLSIFRTISSTFPLDHDRDDLFTIEDVRDLVSLKRKFSDFSDKFSDLDTWPFKVKSFESMSKEEYKIEKTYLPSVYFHAKAIDLTTPKSGSGFFCIDLDYSDNCRLINFNGMQAIKDHIFESFKSVQMIFLSPSRKGLKIIHKYSVSGDLTHGPSHTFESIFKEFDAMYKDKFINIDPKCKNWNRHCLMSYDRELLYRDAETYHIYVNPPVVKEPVAYDSDATGYKLGGPKITCPKCGHHRRFRAYVDSNGNQIPGTGLCDRNNSCQANIKPKDVYPDKKWYLDK